MRLVLASASPRRAELLSAAGFVFERLAVDVNERLRTNETATDYVRRLAMEKSARALELIVRSTDDGPAEVEGLAQAGHYVGTGDRSSEVESSVSRTVPSIQAVVLGADTAVVVDGRILGKPIDDGDAAAMLRQLSGRSHEVLTGLSLRGTGWERGGVTATTVEFAAITDADIAWYVISGEGRDKAGGYAIQGLASRFIPRIEGSYSNVVGLPITAVHALLAEIASRPLSRLS